MWSAGLGRWSVAMPVIMLAVFATADRLSPSLYLMPLGYRMMKDKVYEIRADIATGLFREGAFTYPVKGVTVFVREVTAHGRAQGHLRAGCALDQIGRHVHGRERAACAHRARARC